MVIEIIEAKYVSEYKIHFTFSDQTDNIVDFESFLMNAKNPMCKKYLDINLFEDFSIS